MSVEIIRAALESKVKAWADSRNPVLPVAYENVSFTRPTESYAECFLLPVPTDSQSLDRKHRQYEGVFQVSIHIPKGSGSAAGNALAQSLDAVFDTSVPTVKSGLTIYITSPMSRLQAIVGDTHYSIPVSCSYRADAFL